MKEALIYNFKNYIMSILEISMIAFVHFSLKGQRGLKNILSIHTSRKKTVSYLYVVGVLPRAGLLWNIAECFGVVFFDDLGFCNTKIWQ